MTMLRIGDNLINERVFVGIFCYDRRIEGSKNGTGYVCTLHAKYLVGKKECESKVGSYNYENHDDEDTITKKHLKALADAMYNIKYKKLES